MRRAGRESTFRCWPRPGHWGRGRPTSSAGMLARARARGIAFALQHTSLQDLSYVRQFDAVLTIDAMGHIPPERLARRAGQSAPGCPAGWPGVPDSPGTGPAPYPAGLREPLRTRAARGARELAEPDAPGYHYHPGRDQAVDWFGRRGWRSSMRASGGETGGAITTSCCARARPRQHRDTVRAPGQLAAPGGPTGRTAPARLPRPCPAAASGCSPSPATRAAEDR